MEFLFSERPCLLRWVLQLVWTVTPSDYFNPERYVYAFNSFPKEMGRRKQWMTVEGICLASTVVSVLTLSHSNLNWKKIVLRQERR